MSITLSRGSLLNVFNSRRVYQPLWQIIHVFQPDRPIQLLVSDGENTANCVTLKPSCHVTYNKTEWKMKTGRKSPDEVLVFYKNPVFKIIDFEVARNESTSILLLTKIKLMGWCKDGETPEMLTRETIPLISPKGPAYTISFQRRDLIEEWDRPRFQFSEGEDGLESLCVYNDPFSRSGARQPGAETNRTKPYTEKDLLTGELAILGPNYLDVLKICSKCRLLCYQTESRTASFTPPTKNFVKGLASLEILGNQDKLHFCSCDDENEKFREEFQSKCIVVNQENSPNGKSNKVQCILIGKNVDDSPEKDNKGKKKGKKSLTNGKSYESKIDTTSELDPDYMLPQHVPRSVKYSAAATVCERCGVEDTNMASCRQCQKVFYCSAPCKRADVKEHATVCRAYITVRRYGEEREVWAAQLREPEDGCANCGFWRDSLNSCKLCNEVSFCSSRCEERGLNKHKPVCDAYRLIQVYTDKLTSNRRSEMD